MGLAKVRSPSKMNIYDPWLHTHRNIEVRDIANQREIIMDRQDVHGDGIIIKHATTSHRLYEIGSRTIY